MMEIENWLPIPGYVGHYAVSDHGRVMSMNYMNTGIPGILAQTKLRNGYLSVNLSKDGEAHRFTVHSLVALAFLGMRDAGRQVNHKDGKKLNNRLSNLEYCSASENKNHAWKLGLQRKRLGEDHQNSKLTVEKVLQIRARLANGEKASILAPEFGVSRATIIHVGQRKVWAHVQESLQ